ncbi:DUF1648 domain-containing protein [Cohnella hongkongensis]|uniref:DUF1648 domain-containing protein n=1 Tax=Cohnella hongkongensis TaxID=178337 RepID=A0ABV9F7T8_9BACL
MTKQRRIALIWLTGAFAVLLGATFFLPDRIPFHFNAKGEAGWHASKYFILCLAPVPYLMYRQFTRNPK